MGNNAGVTVRWSLSRHARYYHRPGQTPDTIGCGGALHLGNLQDGLPPLFLVPCPDCYDADIKSGRTKDERDFPGMLNRILEPREDPIMWQAARDLFAEGYTSDTVLYGLMYVLNRPEFRRNPAYLRGVVVERMHRQRAMPVDRTRRIGIDVDGVML